MLYYHDFFYSLFTLACRTRKTPSVVVFLKIYRSVMFFVPRPSLAHNATNPFTFQRIVHVSCSMYRNRGSNHTRVELLGNDAQHEELGLLKVVQRRFLLTHCRLLVPHLKT